MTASGWDGNNSALGGVPTEVVTAKKHAKIFVVFWLFSRTRSAEYERFYSETLVACAR